VLTALRQFGSPLLDLSEADLCAEDTVFQIGVPPSRIDILTGISGVGFDDAWERRMDVAIGPLTVGTIGRLDFIENKGVRTAEGSGGPGAAPAGMKAVSTT
jgi:hypothetical protein